MEARLCRSKSLPLVTVVTPLYNGERFISRCMESVRAQTYPHLEHIIIDDMSSDGGVEMVRAHADDRVTLVADGEKRGAAGARNVGIERASGRYIAFLDCDDYWASDKLEKQISLMLTQSLAFSWSGYHVVDGNEKVVRTQAASRVLLPEDILSKKAVIGCLTAIYDAYSLGKIYMPEIRMRQDMCLFYSIAKMCHESGYAMAGHGDVLAMYSVHDSNMTRSKARAAYFQWKAYRRVFGYGLLKSAKLFGSYVFYGIIDRIRRGK